MNKSGSRGKSFALFVIFVISILKVYDVAATSASVIDFSPTSFSVGSPTSISVTIKNTGSSASTFALYGFLSDNNNWKITGVASTYTLSPGEQKAVDHFTITPLTEGTVNLEIKIYDTQAGQYVGGLSKQLLATRASSDGIVMDFTPTSFSVGSPTSISVTIKNTGSSASTFALYGFLSDSNNWKITGALSTYILAPGEQKTVNHFTITPLRVGSTSLEIKIYDNNAGQYLSGLKKQISAEAVVSKGKIVDFSPSSFSVGNPTSISVTVKNAGTSSGSYSLYGFISNTKDWEITGVLTTYALAPGEQKTVDHFTITPLTESTTDLEIKIYDNNAGQYVSELKKQLTSKLSKECNYNAYSYKTLVVKVNVPSQYDYYINSLLDNADQLLNLDTCYKRIPLKLDHDFVSITESGLPDSFNGWMIEDTNTPINYYLEKLVPKIKANGKDVEGYQIVLIYYWNKNNFAPALTYRGNVIGLKNGLIIIPFSIIQSNFYPSPGDLLPFSDALGGTLHELGHGLLDAIDHDCKTQVDTLCRPSKGVVKFVSSGCSYSNPLSESCFSLANFPTPGDQQTPIYSDWVYSQSKVLVPWTMTQSQSITPSSVTQKLSKEVSVIDFSPSTLSVGSQTPISVTIQNRGTLTGTFSLYGFLSNSNDWEIVGKAATYTLAPGEQRTIDHFVVTPFRESITDLEIKVYDTQANQYVDGQKKQLRATGSSPIKYNKVVLLANPIDYTYSLDLLRYLKNNQVGVVHLTADSFGSYKDEKFIIILGGPNAYEGVGDIVQNIIDDNEANFLRTPGNKKSIIKSNVWATGQKVVIFAGSDRHQTQYAILDNMESAIK